MSDTTINESREKFEVTFIIQSSKLDFEAISAAMNIAPSYTHKAGDVSLTKKYYHMICGRLRHRHLRDKRNRSMPSLNGWQAIKTALRVYKTD